MLNRRTQLNRTQWHRKPPKPGKPKQRGAYLRRVSKKRAKQDRAMKPLKDAWLACWSFCWWCGARRCAIVVLAIHHISKRSHGGKWEQVCNWFCCCDVCNCGPMESSDKATQAKALMLKQRHDPAGFDLEEWNRIHSNRGERISQAAVDAAEREMQC